ncbi:MAG: alpha/beta fold hydrolase [Opitutaceae bacterium]|nr:alpha/beta fold hydrolase [Opitutaceae bacterium]
MAVAVALGIVVFAVVAVVAGPRWLLSQTVRTERRAAGLELHKIAVVDHEIAYLDGGSGEVVILLHGFGAEKDNWTHFARYLTAHYRVVAPDLPGFGDSSFVEGASYRIADQARRLAAFADALGIARFHLAGNSMGGQIAGQFAVLYPERVQSLVLVDCTGVKSPKMGDMETAIRRGESNPLVVASVTEFDHRMEYLFVRQPEIPGFIKRVLVAQALDRQARHETILAQTTPEVEALEPDLGRIRARTLIVWGERDRMRDVSSVSVLQNGIAGATAVILPDCGHVPMSERPEETAAHVLRFMAGTASSES